MKNRYLTWFVLMGVLLGFLSAVVLNSTVQGDFAPLGVDPVKIRVYAHSDDVVLFAAGGGGLDSVTLGIVLSTVCFLGVVGGLLWFFARRTDEDEEE